MMRFVTSLLGGALGAALLLAGSRFIDQRWIDHPIISIERAVGYSQAQAVPAYAYRGNAAPVARREVAPAYRPTQTKLGLIY